jgi:hypothetical protein
MSAQASSSDRDLPPVRRDWKWAFRAKPKPPPRREGEEIAPDKVMRENREKNYTLSILLSGFWR